MAWGVKQTVIMVGVGVSMSVWAALLYVLLRTKDDDKLDVPKCNVQTSRQTIIKMKIPKAAVGSVIGRNGCNIKELQQRTNTRINFEDADDDDDERTVIIRGSPFDSQEAENIINKIVIEQPEFFTEEIYVPSRSCGRIIGKNGESIKYINRTSKAKISVDSNSEDKKVESLTRIVLRGTRQQIDMAIGLIDEKLAEDEALRHQVELISTNRPTRYKGKLCIENSKQDAESVKFQESLMPTANDGFLEVFVSAVESPSQFWVQLVGTKSIQLDRMVEEMTSFYVQPKNQELSKMSTVSVGDLVAATFPHDNLWYRAKVTNVEEDEYSAGESKITVFYVDFGDDGVLLQKQLFTLQPEFLVIPFQAIECCLGNVAPCDKWTEEAISYFEQLTYAAQWKPIMAKPINYIAKDTDKKATVACVTLIDTNLATDVNVAEELIKKEYGVRVFDERLKRRILHFH